MRFPERPHSICNLPRCRAQEWTSHCAFRRGNASVHPQSSLDLPCSQHGGAPFAVPREVYFCFAREVHSCVGAFLFHRSRPGQAAIPRRLFSLTELTPPPPTQVRRTDEAKSPDAHTLQSRGQEYSYLVLLVGGESWRVLLLLSLLDILMLSLIHI